MKSVFAFIGRRAPAGQRDFAWTQRARFLQVVLAAAALAAVPIGLINLGSGATSFASFLFLGAGLSVIGLVLARRGLYRLAAALLASLLFTAIVFTILDGDGLSDPGVTAIPLFILIVSFFFGRGAVLPAGALGVGTVLLLYALHQQGNLRLAEEPSIGRVVVISIILGLAAVLSWVLLDTWEKSLAHIRQGEQRFRLLSRELHDSVTQTLYSIRLTLEAARMALARDPDRVSRLLTQVDGLLVGALGEMRSLLRQARPEALEQQGLVAALGDHIAGLKARDELNVEYIVEGDREIPVEHELALYRAAQEALSNVSKHAGVKQARVRVDLRGDPLVLEIEDQGVGFDGEAVESRKDGLGMTGIRERAEVLGGKLIVASAPGMGTRLRFEIPVSVPENPHG